MVAKDYATLKTAIAAAIPDNISRQVDPTDVRDTGFVDVIDSLLTGITSVSDLLAMDITSFADGTIAQVSGFATPGDGGGGLFRLDEAHGFPIDNGVIVDANWRRNMNGQPPIPQWWGAKGDTITNDGVALQRWLDFLKEGVPDNDTGFTIVTPAMGHLPAGIYITNQELRFTTLGGYQSLTGEGKSTSIIIAGAAIASILKVSTFDAVYQFQTLEHLGFDGNDLAAVGVDAVDSPGFTMRECFLRQATTHNLICGLWGTRITDNVIWGQNVGEVDHVATCIHVTASQATNGLIIDKNTLNRCTKAVDFGQELGGSPQAVTINANVFDDCDETAIFIPRGCSLISIHDNYFELCGDLGADAQVASETCTFTNSTNRVDDVAHGRVAGDIIRFDASAGTLPAELFDNVRYFLVNPTANDFQVSLTLGGAAVTFTDNGAPTITYNAFEIWYGNIVAFAPFNAQPSGPLQHLNIERNRFADSSLKTIASIGKTNGLRWKDNLIANPNIAASLIALKQDASLYTAMHQNEIDQEVSDRATTITSADSGADTITVAAALDTAVGLPFRVTGGSLPAGLTDGEVVFTMAEASSVTTFQVSSTIGGSAINIGGTGTGTISRLSQFSQLVDFSAVTNRIFNANGIVIREHRGALHLRSGIGATKSLGGNPLGWILPSGTSIVTEEPTKFEGNNRVWKVSGIGQREIIFDMEEINGMRGKYYRVSGLARGISSSGGIRFLMDLDDGAGFVNDFDHNVLSTDDWSQFLHSILYIPWDTENVKFRILAGSTNDGYLTQFSISDASHLPNDVPIATDEDPTYGLEIATGTFTLLTGGTTQIDSSGGAVTGTLGSGQVVGQLKTIVMINAANSSTIEITNHQTTNPEEATFDAVDETGVFMWTGLEWVTIFATCTFV